MFEEICLVCGKYLDDDARAYCSEDCQNLDTSSPSISSASSAVSSPNLGYATGGDVPALIPSALGSALNKYTRHHYSFSSSSASSTSWSAVTDDEDDAYLSVSSYRNNRFHDSTDSFYEGSSKSANFLDSMKPSALSYARRPSGTNNRSTVPNPNPHSRTNSAHVPRSAPLHSHLSTDDDGGYSDIGFSSRDESESEFHVLKPVSPSKIKRNRASLPACFSLLQMSNLADGKGISPVSSSSGNTIARPSPPTPKVPLAGLTHSSSTIPSVTSVSTPRGRRRVQDHSHASRGDSSSRSQSHSHSRWAPPQFSPGPFKREIREESGVDRLPGPDLSRGRTALPRNSSPPPKMVLSTEALEDHNRALAAAARTEDAISSGFRKARGRAKAEIDVNAPGYGHGRSGLLDRERALGSRLSRAL
ncbi:hypothetical protein D9615_004151 [Tricholomella constricta]|uniref:Uncharacterized protein n=1 Tax=Tricholomella constricta TaxID=117010 RepID=A0A8H5HC68_9AGAR|nr:hypothetical protein D9615_004151 [Tricholomella constricta]